MVVNIEKDARLSETWTRWNSKAILTMTGTMTGAEAKQATSASKTQQATE